MDVKKFSVDEWKMVAEEIHAYAFSEDRPQSLNTFDFALMVLKDNKPMCYATCIELDSECVYMQHGGKLPDADGTINVAKGYVELIKYLNGKYKNITTKIQNTNTAMQRLALSVGLVPTGIDFYSNQIFLIFNTNHEGNLNG